VVWVLERVAFVLVLVVKEVAQAAFLELELVAWVLELEWVASVLVLVVKEVAWVSFLELAF
jgi:hypothetical protein